jgi:large subunit ribosomal protein L35
LNGLAMPKIKSKRSAAKRFTFTATGKVKRAGAMHRHNLTHKPKSAKMAHRQTQYLEPGDAALVRRMLPHG